VFSDPPLQTRFRDGLQWLDRASAPAADFVSLSAIRQNALLERLAYKAKQQESEKAGQQFFLLFRKYTVMGFYTTRAGLESLDYPGLTSYATSPGCTHAGNPEHVGL
jgi:gluconate 2-dehydrogenase gamma chain